MLAAKQRATSTKTPDWTVTHVPVDQFIQNRKGGTSSPRGFRGGLVGVLYRGTRSNGALEINCMAGMSRIGNWVTRISGCCRRERERVVKAVVRGEAVWSGLVWSGPVCSPPLC